MKTPPQLETGIAATPDGKLVKGFAYPGSLVRLPTGKLMAVFTGHPDTAPMRALGVYSSDGGKTWSQPVTIFGGEKISDASSDLEEGYGDPNLVVVNDKRVIFFCVSLKFTLGKLVLDRTRWWRRTSEDGGETFGPVQEMPRHRKYIVGTTHPGFRLRDGRLAMSYSWDKPAEVGRPADGEGTMDLVSGVLTSADEGATWQPGGDLHADTSRSGDALAHATNGVDEPAAVELPSGDLFMLLRTGTDRLWQSFSHDVGATWEPATPSPLVSHNCPAAMLRLNDGTILVVFNHHRRLRARMSVAVSRDGCRTWSEPKVIGPVGHEDESEASYPAICQLPDEMFVVVFGQINRGDPADRFHIRWVRFNRAWLGV